MPKTKIIPTKQERELAKQIVSESGVVITFGRTNGKTVLHAKQEGLVHGSFTLKSAADWEECPLNPRVARATRKSNTSVEREREIDALTSIIANRDAI